MLILGIETATPVTSVALYDATTDHSVSRLQGDTTRTHSGALVGLVQSLLHRAGKTVDQLSALAIATGPGSFTGLRVGLGAALGMGDGCGIPVYGAPTLDAIVEAHGSGAAPHRLALLPSRKGEAYVGFYRRSDSGYQPIGAPAPMPVADVARHLPGVTEIVGGGSDLCAEILQGDTSGEVTVAGAPLMSLAEALTRRVARAVADGTASSLPPTLDYVQKPQAERLREERLAKGGAGSISGTTSIV